MTVEKKVINQKCYTCDGKGTVNQSKCSQCNGTGIFQESTYYHIDKKNKICFSGDTLK